MALYMISERAKRAPISSVQWKSAINIYLYVYIVFFYGTFTHSSTNNLDSTA